MDAADLRVFGTTRELIEQVRACRLEGVSVCGPVDRLGVTLLPRSLVGRPGAEAGRRDAFVPSALTASLAAARPALLGADAAA